MESTQEQLLNQLLESAKVLGPDRLLEALDFVGYLRSLGPAGPRAERGSARALLRHAGAVKFGPGELNQLLADVTQMRELDLEQHGRLPA
jgi:hypothetical protein